MADMPFDPSSLVLAPSSLPTGKSKPRKAPRRAVQTGHSSFCLELRQTTGSKLSDDAVAFLIRVGCKPSSCTNTNETVRHATKQRNVSITVKRWRVRIKDAKQVYPMYAQSSDLLAALASDASIAGFGTFYAGIDNQLKRFSVSPFAMGAGDELKPKHSQATQRRATYRVNHTNTIENDLLSMAREQGYDSMPVTWLSNLDDTLLALASWRADRKALELASWEVRIQELSDSISPDNLDSALNPPAPVKRLPVNTAASLPHVAHYGKGAEKDPCPTFGPLPKRFAGNKRRFANLPIGGISNEYKTTRFLGYLTLAPVADDGQWEY